jgi:hypothetical protein
LAHTLQLTESVGSSTSRLSEILIIFKYLQELAQSLKSKYQTIQKQNSEARSKTGVEPGIGQNLPNYRAIRKVGGWHKCCRPGITQGTPTTHRPHRVHSLHGIHFCCPRGHLCRRDYGGRRLRRDLHSTPDFAGPPFLLYGTYSLQSRLQTTEHIRASDMILPLAESVTERQPTQATKSIRGQQQRVYSDKCNHANHSSRRTISFPPNGEKISTAYPLFFHHKPVRYLRPVRPVEVGCGGYRFPFWKVNLPVPRMVNQDDAGVLRNSALQDRFRVNLCTTYVVGRLHTPCQACVSPAITENLIYYVVEWFIPIMHGAASKIQRPEALHAC